MSRKSIFSIFILVGGAVCVLLILDKESTPSPIDLKVLIIGIDGMDPTMTEQLMAKGELPHLAALAGSGTYSRLQTTNPAESPVAWASFITGSNPGRHGLLGFLDRDPSTYQPIYAPTTLVKGKSVLSLFPLENPRYVSNRKGAGFWNATSQRSLRSVVLWCPETFPAEEINGEMLSGMEVPDIQGSTGTFSFYTSEESAISPPGASEMVIPIRFENGKAHTVVRGASNWLKEELESTPIPLSLELLKNGTVLAITLEGRTQQLEPGEWSDWFEMRFRLNVFTTVRAIGRFYLQSTTPSVKLYLGPLNIDPRDPIFPISSPKSFSADLAKSVGLFKTVGWETDTWGVNEGFLDERALLSDSYETVRKQEAIVLNLLEKKQSGLFFAVFGGLDRLQHVFWHYVDQQHPLHNPKAPHELQKAVESFYIEMDRIIGNILSRIDGRTTFILLSDHGMASFRRGLNLNTWLVKNGFMRIRADADSLPSGTFFPDVEWRQTKAYALGIGGIYLNVAGREGKGIVREGEEYEKVRNQIIKKLTVLKDGKTGDPVVHRVYKQEDVYKGAYSSGAPDLVVGLNPGYRVSQTGSLGGFEPLALMDNLRRWSGDHVSIDPQFVPGVLFTNRKVQFSAPPSITDIAPTVLELLGLTVPAAMDGKNVFVSEKLAPK